MSVLFVVLPHIHVSRVGNWCCIFHSLLQCATGVSACRNLSSLFLSLWDGVGEQVNTERSIRHAMQERLPIVLVINKVGGYSYFLCTGSPVWIIIPCERRRRGCVLAAQ